MLFIILLLCPGTRFHPKSSVHRCPPTCSDQVQLKLFFLSLSCCCYNIKVSTTYSVEFSTPGQDRTPGASDNRPLLCRGKTDCYWLSTNQSGTIAANHFPFPIMCWRDGTKSHLTDGFRSWLVKVFCSFE